MKFELNLYDPDGNLLSTWDISDELSIPGEIEIADEIERELENRGKNLSEWNRESDPDAFK